MAPLNRHFWLPAQRTATRTRNTDTEYTVTGDGQRAAGHGQRVTSYGLRQRDTDFGAGWMPHGGGVSVWLVARCEFATNRWICGSRTNSIRVDDDGVKRGGGPPEVSGCTKALGHNATLLHTQALYHFFSPVAIFPAEPRRIARYIVILMGYPRDWYEVSARCVFIARLRQTDRRGKRAAFPFSVRLGRVHEPKLQEEPSSVPDNQESLARS